MNSLLRRDWIKGLPRLAASLSVISLLTLLKRRDLFKRTLSDAYRSFYRAWEKCLPDITPQEITGNPQPVRLILNRQKMSLSLLDLVPLLEILKLSGAKRVLEVGTSSGGTTWHLAANAGDEASIITVDLPPDASYAEYSSQNLSTVRPSEDILGMHFRGSLEEQRIRQVLLDSKNLLSMDFEENFDLIFVDAGHSYEFVKQDTENALKLIKNGGYIVWHDYFVFNPGYGVMRCLHELNRRLPVYHLRESLCGIARIIT